VVVEPQHPNDRLSPNSVQDTGRPRRPVVVGEVLFDVFDDGARVLGGAPFNVAWHLQGFGLEPLLLTRIGDDPDGRSVTEAMRSWGLDPRGLQVDPSAATGVVHVTDKDGEPSYDIVPDRAFDRLDREDAFAAIGETAGLLLYHGTLAARCEPSRATILALRRKSELPVFVDVNLRDPWWNPDETSSMMSDAAWVKLNQHELSLLARFPDPTEDMKNDETESTADRLRRSSETRQIIVTRGEDGALVVSDAGIEKARPKLVDRVVDTVGAGDAFSAVWICGLAHGWSTQTTLERALGFAARICSIRGATTTHRGLYRDVMAEWDRHAYDRHSGH